ncbi:coil containing protein [Vibrio phage 1.205.O._10N.222.51.A7]|nr:coil containing protein [Vibrio phage 1.205.O._10N.222.51.A7]
MRTAKMKKDEINKLAKAIERNIDDDLVSLGDEAAIDCADMPHNEKRAYLRGYRRAKEKDD